MSEWWSNETSLGHYEISSISHMSPSRQNNMASLQPLAPPPAKNSYNVVTVFCTDENIPSCVAYINQELGSLGLPSSIQSSAPGSPGVNTVPALNAMFELLKIHRRDLVALEDLEREHLRKTSTLEHLQMSKSRLKDQLELSMREKSGLHETERQLQLKIKTLQRCLKTEKDEVQKLQSIISSRASQCSHDAKRREKEFSKLKERLSQLLIDRKDKRLAIDVLNCVGRADSKRSQWKTSKAAVSHEDHMYKCILGDYEERQRSLVLENVELKKVLQLMRKEMNLILSPRPSSNKPAGANHEQVDSDGEETSDDTREMLDKSCEQAREQLTNSIRQQWRKLRNHVEQLDSQAQNPVDKDVIPRETHEEEMDRMRREVQQCRAFIDAQQQLLQQQLNASFDDDTASLLNGCYTLEEKERLKEEWRLFEEQKRNFERERKNFTDAAIRLGREKKAFEEDRASWLKNQFLNMTPFSERRRCSLVDGHSASSIKSEPEIRTSSKKPAPGRSSTFSSFSTPKVPRTTVAPSTAELYRTLRLIPDGSSSRNISRWQESSSTDDESTRAKSMKRHLCSDLSIFTLGEDETGLA